MYCGEPGPEGHAKITRTVYDLPYPSYRTATFYSYDVLGNVDSLLQDYGTSGVMSSTNRFKLMTYNYDLVSGKVNQVSYQPGKADGFYHQYDYDAENRLTGVRTSADSILWQDDAVYTYYRHGPLARAQLGDLGVQGLDYAYTVQGWLKAINPSWTDGGSGDRFDGDGTTAVASIERDAYKLTLNYFDDGTYLDYLPSAPPSGFVYNNGLPSAKRTNLYNGNIGSQAVSIRKLATGSAYSGPLVYNYGYDQLNRIASMDAWAADGNFVATGTSPMGDYAERYGYDPNGNILTLNRHGTTGTGLAQAMDSLRYQYVYVKSAGAGLGEYVPGAAPTSGVDHLTNQLSSIRDDVSSTGYDDIKNQSVANYGYDAIGNLVSDVQSGITSISWSVYGKILSITNGSGTIYYTYDASGNRISKLAGGITTWYVRDATGNVMSVYSEGNSSLNSGALSKTEAHVYGSSRLGMLNLGVNCTDLTPPAEGRLIRGSKLFELANHLGNVLATVSDKKIQHTTDNSIVDYYTADVIGANDYYPFGMGMPGRSYNNGSYRYGFNGQEKTDEIAGVGNHTTAEFWEYDPRIGRRWNLDPVKKPWQSDYVTLSNSPIWKLDPNGDDDFFNSQGQLIKRTNTGSKIYVQSDKGNVLLTQLPLTNAHNRQAVATVAEYYARQVGVTTINNGGKGIIGLAAGNKASEDNPAFTAGQDIFINKKDNKINSNLDDYYNLENTLVHEKFHKSDNEDPLFKSNLQTHVNVYLKQIKDETFRKGTEDFQKGIVGSFGNYLLNYYADFSNGGSTQLEKYISDFNKNNKAGYSIQLDVSSQDETDYKVNIYKNKKLIGTENYKKIKNEGGDD